MSLAKQWLLLPLVLGASLGLATARDPISTGPLASRFKLTLEPGEREELLGPLCYDETTPTRDLAAMPPLWSSSRDPETGFTEVDFCYPVLTYDRFGEEYRFQILQCFSFTGGRVSQTETNVSRFTLFPFYFQQRSAIPEKNYTAVLPFYGRLQNRMFRSEVEWIGWPLYVRTKRLAKPAPAGEREENLEFLYRHFTSAPGEVTTYNFLVPFFHVRTGPRLQGWQAWPLVGEEHKQPFTQTNRWGEELLDPGHEKFFALWPFFMKEKTGLGSTNEEHQTVVLPFCSVMRSPLRDSITAPWPLGLTYTVDRARKYTEWDMPWPLVVFARGEGKTANRVWPFFSQAHSDTLESSFYLWPIYKYNAIHSAPLERRRTRILFYLYSDTTEKNTETSQAKRRVDAWPLFTFRRDWAGNERWQTFSVLEPFLPASKSIERNYSQLWSVLRAERNAKTGARSESLLWNLYRHDNAVTNQHSSLLFGLVQWRTGPEGRKARWFYLPGETSY